MPKMVEMVIDSVRVSLTNQQRIVVLREVHAERYLPIWIGPYEAESITIALQEIEVARPQTHDLLKSAILALNARLVRVEVVALREDVYYGNLVLESDGQTLEVDSRPSDALALAVRFHVPILVSSDVLNSAGITPSQDLQQQGSETGKVTIRPSEEESEEAPLETGEEGEDRLSIFEDFLDNLNIGGDKDSGNPADSSPDVPGDEPDAK